ncbi:MAG: phosphotransferase enzyme family protein [Actinomycetota bacterium]
MSAARPLAVPLPSRAAASVSARLRPPAIDAARVARVLEAYGLAPHGRPRTLALGHRSGNVVISTGSGRQVLKRYRDAWTPETIAYGHEVIRRLHTGGVPAPVLAETSDGRTCVEDDGARFALFGFVEGRAYASAWVRRRDRLALLGRAGAALARMHAALAGWEPPGTHHLASTWADGAGPHGPTWYEERAAAMQRAAGWDSPADRFAEACAALAGTVFPTTVIHGDFGLHNVLVRRDGTIVPVDLELARLDLRAHDLVLTLGKLRDARPAAPDVEAMETFLRGYTTATAVTEPERASLPELWRRYHLASAIRAWDLFDRTGRADRRDAAARALDRAAWLDTRPDVIARLRAALAAPAREDKEPADA